MSKNMLVTGAAGFIGSHVCQHLAEAGHEVVGVDNFSNYYSSEIKRLNANTIVQAGVELVEYDLAEDPIRFDDCDVLIHFAAQPGISEEVPFSSYEKNNIQATQKLVSAAESAKSPPYFLYISTSSVYGLEATGTEDSEPKPASDYGVTKLSAEQLVMSSARQKNLMASSLRLFSVYGPRERPEKLFPKLLLSAETGQPFPLYEGSREHVRSFTYVDDVVEAVSKVIEHRDVCDGEIINIGNDQTNTTGEAIATVEEVLDTEIEIDLQPSRPGDQKKTSANIDKAKELLDWEPETTLKEGVTAHAQWFIDNEVSELM